MGGVVELRTRRPDFPSQLASFQGKHLVVSGGNSYLQTNAVLIAMDRERRKALSAEREALAGSRLAAPADASDAEDGAEGATE